MNAQRRHVPSVGTDQNTSAPGFLPGAQYIHAVPGTSGLHAPTQVDPSVTVALKVSFAQLPLHNFLCKNSFAHLLCAPCTTVLCACRASSISTIDRILAVPIPRTGAHAHLPTMQCISAPDHARQRALTQSSTSPWHLTCRLECDLGPVT